MIIINREFNRTSSPTSSGENPIDDTEWIDWDRWCAADEYQDLLDGLSNVEDSGGAKSFKNGEWDENVARLFHRQGFEVEG